MPKIIQGKFKIIFNRRVGPDYFKLAIYAPRIVQKAGPGQFVHLRCQNTTEPLLRRPFSFHRFNKNNFEVLYKVIGRGTNLLAKKCKGDRVDVLGPLGNGFDIKKPETRNQKPEIILVAGGMGVAPLFALAEELAYGIKRIADRRKILVLIGAKTKEAILCAKDFRKLGVRVQIATDDGSQGYKGLVTDLLKKVLRTTNDERRTTIYTCGPKPMLQEIACQSLRLRITSFGSLEENMACGVGACLGCAVKTQDGYKMVCKDGPVFSLKEINYA